MFWNAWDSSITLVVHILVPSIFFSQYLTEIPQYFLCYCAALNGNFCVYPALWSVTVNLTKQKNLGLCIDCGLLYHVFLCVHDFQTIAKNSCSLGLFLVQCFIYTFTYFSRGNGRRNFGLFCWRLLACRLRELLWIFLSFS